MITTIMGTQVREYEEIHREMGPHIFTPDAEYTFDPQEVIVSPAELTNYIGYQEVGTLIAEHESLRTFRTTFTKVPQAMFEQVLQARADFGRAFERTFMNMGANDPQEAAAAGLEFANAKADYAWTIAQTFHVPNVDRVVVYHTKHLLTPQLATEQGTGGQA